MKPCIMDYLGKLMFPNHHRKPPMEVSEEEVQRARQKWRDEFHKRANIQQASVKTERDEKKANDEAINAAKAAIALFESTKQKGIFK